MREQRRGARGVAGLNRPAHRSPAGDTGITNRLSVVVPATDAPPTLGRVLTAIRSAADAPDEVIVVDRPPGLGPAAARNLGAERAVGEILAFVDSDVEVHPDAFTRIRASFARDPDLTAVFGSYDDDPDADDIVSDFRNLLHHHVHQQGAGPATTFWAGLGAIRRDAFERVGGFDADRFPHASIEDIELGLRLARDGRRIVLEPTIQGKHLKRWTLGQMAATDLRRRAIPWLRLMLEESSHSTALNLDWSNRVGAGASVALLAFIKRRNLRLAGLTVGLLVALDLPFYALLRRRRGWPMLATGVPLHIAHRLTSAAALPLAVTGHLLTRGRRRTRAGK